MSIPPTASLRTPTWLIWLLLLAASTYSLFWRLGAQPLQTWDESRLAASATEMLRSGNYLVVSFQNQPDLWNTKPPLLLWLQALSLHAFGYTEWAFRLPSALAGLALSLLLYVFGRRWLGGPLAGLLAALALLSCKEFIVNHVARTGDYETLLLLFLTTQVAAVFSWMRTRQRRYLVLAGASVGMAVLTKGVAGLFFLPGLGLYALWARQLPALLRQPAFWLGAALAVAPPALWYWGREQLAPGYLQAVWQNELGGRLLTALEQTPEPWYVYLTHFFYRPYLLWTPWLLVAVVVLARREQQSPAFQFLLLAGLVVGLFLAIISASATKHTWYIAPAFPILALLIGGGLSYLAQQLAARRHAPSLALGVLALAYIPSFVALQAHLQKTYRHRYDEAELSYGRYLQDPTRPVFPQYALLHRSHVAATRVYNAGLEFYAAAQRQAHPYARIRVGTDTVGLRPGTPVVVCGAAAQRLLARSFVLRQLHQRDSCGTFQLLTRRVTTATASH